MPDTDLDAPSLTRALAGRAHPVIYLFRTLSSTNTTAREYALAETAARKELIKDAEVIPAAGEWDASDAVFLAGCQTAGRGRRGHSFYSPEGSGIFCSVLRAHPRLTDPGALTTKAAVDAALALRAFGADPTVKWVNDIKLGGKKVAGILAEGIFSPEGTLIGSVLGIGLNVHPAPLPEDLVPIVTFLDRHTPAPADRSEVLAALLSRLLTPEESREKTMALYRSLCPLEGREVTVLRGEERFCATVLTILDSGELLLRVGEEEITLSGGEISIRETAAPTEKS